MSKIITLKTLPTTQSTAKLYLNITTANGKTERLPLTNKTIKMQGKASFKYHITDEEGRVVDGVRLKYVGDDVQVYLPNQSEPQAILQDFAGEFYAPTVSPPAVSQSVLSQTVVPSVGQGVGLAQAGMGESLGFVGKLLTQKSALLGLGAMGVGGAVVQQNRVAQTKETQAKEQAQKEAQAKAEAEKLAQQKAEADRLKAEAEKLAQEQAQKEAQAKAEAEKLAQQKAEAEKLTKEQAQKEAQAKLEAEKLAQQKAEADRLKAEAEKLAQEQAQKEAQAKAEAEKLAQQKAEAEKLTKEQAQKEAQAKLEAEKLAQQKAEAERLKAEAEKAKAEAEKLAQEQAEKLAQQKAEAERLKAEAEKAKAEAEKLAQEQAEKEAQAKAEAEKLAQQKAEADRLKAEAERLKAEAEKLAEQKAEAEKLAKEQAQKEAQAKAEAEKLAEQKAEADRLKAEAEKLAQQKAEAEKLAKEQAQKEAQAEKLAQQKAEAEKAQAERLKAEAEKLAQQKAEAEKAQAERLKAEAEKLAQQKAEADRLKAEAEKLAQQKAEAEKLAKEQAEKEAQAKLEAEKLAQQKAEAEKLAQQKAEADRLKAEADDLAKNPPTVKFNPITDDNVVNISESKTAVGITGTVANIKDGDVLTVSIGETAQQVAIKDNAFTLNIDGKTLILHQAITAQITRGDKVIGEQSHSYTVDTEIATPKVNLNTITDDNIINLNESQNKVAVTGTVQNAKDGDEVIVSCGCPSCTGMQWTDIKTTLKDGKFSVNFDGAVLAKNSIVKASVATSDDAKNTAIGKAEQSYEVDITPPKPSLVYETIGKDNIINQALAQNDITLKAKVINLGTNEVATVKAVINGQEYLAKQNGEFYEVTVSSTQFANGTDVKWQLVATDKAGNQTNISQTQAYTYDVIMSEPTLSIDTPKTVNAQSQGTTLSGTLAVDDDVPQQNIVVQVIVGNQTHLATVHSNKTWTLNLPQDSLQVQQGTQPFTVKLSATDRAGNIAHTQNTGSFVVDTLAPKVDIVLDKIADIDPKGDEMVNITGTVTGEFKPTDKVKVSVNGNEVLADIRVTANDTAVFTAQVAKTILVQNASKSVSAKLDTADNAGNTTQATALQTYGVQVVDDKTDDKTDNKLSDKMSLSLNSLTQDDLINASEAKKDTLAITGNAQNAEGQSVTLTVGEHTQTAVVKDGQFVANIATQILLDNPQAKIVATLGEQKSERAYSVDGFAVASIDISDIGEQFTVFTPKDSVRFTGKVDLNHGIFAKYNNASLIDSITATLNNKTYEVALNADKSFVLDVPVADINNAQGQSFVFGLPQNRFVMHDLKAGLYSDSPVEEITHYATLNDQSKFTLNASPTLIDGKIAPPPEPMTTVQGVVTGGKVGDTVIIQVGNHQHETTLKAQENGNAKQLVFSANIASSELVGVSSEKIVATLKSHNAQNKAFEISATAHYETGNSTGKFAVSHPLADTTDIATDTRAPYFIRSLAFSLNQGHLKKHPLGQSDTAHLTYRFKPSAGSEETYNQTNREVTRKALKMIESYANIKFSEVADTDKADIGYIMSTTGSSARNGFADYGGDVWLSANNYQRGELGLKSRLGWMTTVHETMHSLGAKHPFEGRATLPNQENDKVVSFMNYTKKFTDAGLELPMFDLAYLHYRYGVNKSQRTQDNTYGFKAFNPTVVDGDVYIWDGGGVDTFDASDQTQGVTVNLTPGSWIHSGNKSERFLVDEVKYWDKNSFFEADKHRNLKNVYMDDKMPIYTKGQAFIGYDTQIERLIGSNHNDTLTGNDADNDIYGGRGDDVIDGGLGNDYLDGGLGVDTLTGGQGDDIFVVDDKDSVVELANQGTDSVFAYVDYQLGDNVENLTLLGQATTATGNDLDNRIVGNAHANTLTGKGGKDTFVFNSVVNGTVDTLTDFVVGQDKIELDPAVFTGLTAQNFAERISYDPKTGHLYYDPDGADKADVLHFATLPTNLTLDSQSFVLSSGQAIANAPITTFVPAVPNTPVVPVPTSVVPSTPKDTNATNQANNDSQKGQIVYVSDEQKAGHFAKFEQALAHVKAGDKIVLLKSDTLVGNYIQDADGRVHSLKLPQITIDGQGHTLKIGARPLSLLGDVTFKQMTLALQPLVSLEDAFASFGASGAKESEQFIFLNGHKAVFDEVSTHIDKQHPRTRPTIIMGTEKGEQDAGHAELVVLNADKTAGQTQFKTIMAGSFDADKHTDSVMSLGRGTVVLNEVSMGGKEHQMTGAVTVRNGSDLVKTFNGEFVNNDTLILDNVSYLNEPTLTQIKHLTLLGTSGFTSKQLAVEGVLTLDTASHLQISAGYFSDDDATLSVGQLHTQNATLSLADNATLDLKGDIQGSLTVKTTNSNNIHTHNNNAHIKAIDGGYLLNDKPFNDNTPINNDKLPTVKFAPITDDNIINISESGATVAVTGTLTNAKDGDVLTVQIGQSKHTVDIKNNAFTLNIDGKTLVLHQSIEATLTRDGKNVATTKHDYTVDTDITTPKVSLNNITDDNIINLKESTEQVAVTGTVEGGRDGDEVVISCGCPICTGVQWTDIKTTLKDGKFSVNFDGAVLAKNSIVKASVTTTDTAKNTAIGTDEQSYEVDITPPKPSLVYQAFGKQSGNTSIINQEFVKSEIVLKAKVIDLGANEVATVKAVVNGQEYLATQNGEFYEVAVDSNKFANGTNIKWQLTATDKAGNVYEDTQQQAYVYDTDISTLTVQLSPLPVVNAHSQEVVLTGTLNIDSDINPASVRVMVEYAGNTEQAIVDTQRGTWSLTVPKAHFTDGTHTLGVRVSAQDFAQNTTTAHTQGTLSVDTTPPQVQMQLDPVVFDGTTATIKGKVTGEFSPQDSVVLAVNGTQISTDVLADGSFVAQVPTATLASNQSLVATLHSQDGAGNTTTLSQQHDYTLPVTPTLPIAPPPSTTTPVVATNIPTPPTPPQGKISLHAYDDPSTLVRLTGKVELPNLFGQYKNPTQLHTVIAKLGDKTYETAVNLKDQTFYLDIERQDLYNAKGQTLSFDYKGGWAIYDLNGTKPTYRAIDFLRLDPSDKDNPKDSHFKLNKNDYIDDNHTVKDTLPVKQTLIVGKVFDKAIDLVEIVSGTQTVQAVVKEDLTFSANIDTDKLDNTITAHAKNVTASISHTKSSQSRGGFELGISDKFVATFDTAQQDTPYFIQALENIDQKAGYLKNVAFGGGATLTYAFHKEYYGAIEWTQQNRDATRKALDKYEHYADVHFVPMMDNSGFDAGKNVSANIQFHHRPLDGAAGRASYGGQVSISITHANLDTPNGLHLLMHEIGHSLGAKHPHDSPILMNSAEDNTSLSVLSYKSGQMTVDKQDLRIFDIAFAQYRYGVNPNERTTNDIYTFKTFNQHKGDGDVYIWDGGGVDTFDASKETQGVTVDLTPGSWIYRGTQSERFVVESAKTMTAPDWFDNPQAQHNYLFNKGDVIDFDFSDGQAFIGYGTQIERLIGSEYNDTLTGNVANNAIYGGGGDDTINGGKGADILTGGAGKDTFVFGGMIGGVDIKLSDLMQADTITDFDVNDDTIALSAKTFGTNKDDIKTHIHYDKDNGQLSYSDNGVTVHFATIAKDLDETQIHYTII